MPDVNGTRHHLMLGYADWNRASPQAGRKRKWEYDDATQTVQLQSEIYKPTYLANNEMDLESEPRRGAACDQYGRWYWVEKDKAGEPTQIMTVWAGASQPEPLYPKPQADPKRLSM